MTSLGIVFDEKSAFEGSNKLSDDHKREQHMIVVSCQITKMSTIYTMVCLFRRRTNKHQWSVLVALWEEFTDGFPSQRASTGKVFPCHDVIMAGALIPCQLWLPAEFAHWFNIYKYKSYMESTLQRFRFCLCICHAQKNNQTQFSWKN